jgi:hypothetical protein
MVAHCFGGAEAGSDQEQRGYCKAGWMANG